LFCIFDDVKVWQCIDIKTATKVSQAEF
jgi:hypothetical protein